MALNLQAQTNDFDCGTIDNDTPDAAGVYSYKTDLSTLNSYEPVVHNIFIWGINRDDGTSDDKLTQADALEIIATLNIEYNKFNMFFKYSGFDYINETDIYIPYSSGAISSYVNQNGQYIKQDAINFYVPYDFGSGAAGYGGSPNKVYVRKLSLIPYAIIHEVGHTFTLRHIFAGVGGSNCEHVTRDVFDLDDPYDTYYNANVAGDRVHDTAACPVMRGFSTVGADCEYVGSGADCQGTDFIITNEAQNYMGYNEVRCVNHLTIGQGIRMREEIDEGTYTFAENTVPSLYEPYAGEYINGVSPANTSAKFQPGFDYQYLNCYPDGGYPQPSDYNDTSFNYVNGGFWWYGFSKNIEPQDYNTIIHKNGYAIRIEQLQYQPRKCWNNGIASGGTLITFNDGVLNTNVTITAQDSSSINNEQLVDDLQPGLYNVIKVYQGGRTEETVILKENN